MSDSTNGTPARAAEAAARALSAHAAEVAASLDPETRAALGDLVRSWERTERAPLFAADHLLWEAERLDSSGAAA